MACTVSADAFNFDGMYAHKPFALSSEIWVEVKATFPQATIDATVADTANNAFLMIENENFQWNQGMEMDFVGPGVQLFPNNIGTIGTDNPFVPVADTQYLCEIHLTSNGGVTPYDWEFYVDGALVMSGTSGAHTGWQAIILGWPFGTDTDIFVTYEDLRIGTTRHGTDLLTDDFCSGDFATYDDVFAVAPNVFTFAGSPTPTPSVRFFKDYPWRFVVADLNCATITFLDRLANGKNVTYVINQPAASSGVVPADNPEVNIVHTDGDPFLHHNNRILFGFRREGGTPPWVIRFAGIIMLDDDTAADSPTTRYTAWDPWELLNHRPLLNSAGELPGQNGLSFTNTRGNVIALDLLEWTVGAGTTSVTGDAFIDYGQTGFYTPSFDATPVISINFQQGISVGEAWTQLCDSGTIDIYLKPIYDPINRPGFTHELYLFEQMGSIRRDAIFAWDKPSRSLVGVSRQEDGSQMANVAQYYSGQGGAPVPTEVNVASIAKYGQYWSQQFFPGQNVAALVQLLALAQVRLRANGKRTLTFDPAPERSPIVFLDYFLGDEVPVYTSQRLRAAQATLERVHGIPVEIDDNGVETVRALLTADESVTDT